MNMDKQEEQEITPAGKDAISGECKYCGKTTPSPKIKCCEECKKEKKEKRKTTIQEIVSIVACAGSVLLAIYQIFKGDDTPLGKMTDSELDYAREKVRQSYVKEKNVDKANRLYGLLDKFDKEMNKRAWGGEDPTPSSYHSEHGFYLSEEK